MRRITTFIFLLLAVVIAGATTNSEGTHMRVHEYAATIGKPYSEVLAVLGVKSKNAVLTEDHVNRLNAYFGTAVEFSEVGTVQVIDVVPADPRTGIGEMAVVALSSPVLAPETVVKTDQMERYYELVGAGSLLHGDIRVSYGQRLSESIFNTLPTGAKRLFRMA